MFTGLNKQVDNSKANYNSNIKFSNKCSRHTDEDTDSDSKETKIIDVISFTNISWDKYLSQDIDKQPIIRDDITVDTSGNLKCLMFKMTNGLSKKMRENKNIH